MRMAKRQQDLKEPGVRKRIEEFLREDDVMAEELRVAFEKWARGIGFTDFEVRDEEADDLDREYCDDDVELVWCAFAEGERIGRKDSEWGNG